MDRFPLQVHLEQSDISEVTSRRVLAKNATAQDRLGKLFDEHRARLTSNTQLSAEIRLPELKRESFIDLYPLLPYQIDLVIQVVSGLRTQGGGAVMSVAPTARSSSSPSSCLSTRRSISPAHPSERWPGSITSMTWSRTTSAPRSGRRFPRSRGS